MKNEELWKLIQDLEDNDIEGLLSSLSIDELEDLNNDFDPDVSFFPIISNFQKF